MIKYKWLNRCLINNTTLKRLMTSQGSLTRILKDSHDDFRVERVKESIILKRRQLFWERQVILYCDHQPFVFAISTLPIAKLKTSQWIKLKTIKNQPLGELLFQVKPIIRTRFKFFKIHGYWARESEFHHAISVTEIFLTK